MGSSAHMSAMQEALAAHGEEFREETWSEVPEAVKALGLLRCPLALPLDDVPLDPP